MTVENMPILEIGRRHMTVKMPDLISEVFNVSKSEARRKLKEGAIKIDGEKWEHLTGCVADVDGKILQFGKRKFVRIVDKDIDD